ncbi:hypothetical protein [Sphingomonas faeni]|uniref:hypothetical protein n=1 Tax=Sphingomonas faeni TaxID=185950 RepID=UPI0027D9224C|nr:hypothetical protein [Sphingomonas faeni]
MLLFAACLVASLSVSLTSPRQRDGLNVAAFLVLAFFASLVPGLLVDASNGTSLSVIGLELQPLLFWLSAPFFAMALQDAKTVEKAGNILLFGGLAVAAVTSLLMVGLYAGFVSFGAIYLWGDATNELFFRGPLTFFYKGHFFVGIALVFCVILAPRRWKAMATILAFSLVLSVTRGLYLAVVLAIVFSFFAGRRPIAIVLTLVAAILIVGLYGETIINLIFDPSRAASGETRSRDFSYFLATFTSRTLLFGDGTGTLLNNRHNIENSYVWAIWRFGIVGLSFWLLPLFISAKYFFKVPYESEYRKLASAFFFGVVMLYVVTAFNPFVNNSIGLTYLLCAIFSLRRLSLAVVDRPILTAGLHV